MGRDRQGDCRCLAGRLIVPRRITGIHTQSECARQGNTRSSGPMMNARDAVRCREALIGPHIGMPYPYELCTGLGPHTIVKRLSRVFVMMLLMHGPGQRFKSPQRICGGAGHSGLLHGAVCRYQDRCRQQCRSLLGLDGLTRQHPGACASGPNLFLWCASQHRTMTRNCGPMTST